MTAHSAGIAVTKDVLVLVLVSNIDSFFWRRSRVLSGSRPNLVLVFVMKSKQCRRFFLSTILLAEKFSFYNNLHSRLKAVPCCGLKLWRSKFHIHLELLFGDSDQSNVVSSLRQKYFASEAKSWPHQASLVQLGMKDVETSKALNCLTLVVSTS